MSVGTYLHQGRTLAAGLMVDVWRCSEGGGRVFDDATGEWSDVPVVVVYDGPGRLRDRSSVGSRDNVQGETTVTSQLILSLPVATSGDVRVGHVIKCTAAEDAALVGMRVKVTDLHLQTHSTARRFSVEVESWPTT